MIDVYRPQILAELEAFEAEHHARSTDGITRFTLVDLDADDWRTTAHPSIRSVPLGHDPLVADDHTNPGHFTLRTSSEVIATRVADALNTREGRHYGAALYDVADGNPSGTADIAGAYIFGHAVMWDLAIARWDPNLNNDDQMTLAFAALNNRAPDLAALVAWLDINFKWFHQPNP